MEWSSPGCAGSDSPLPLGAAAAVSRQLGVAWGARTEGGAGPGTPAAPPQALSC